jgi:ABC-type nitrate/sulfonate/bicarbonate transport system permease component
MKFPPIARPSDPSPLRPSMDARKHPGNRGALRQKLISALYTVVGVALFFGVWWEAASQLPRSRLVTPLEAGYDIWTNFLYSPRLSVFGLGKVGYGSLLLYTVGNVLTGLVIGGAIGILLGIASARLRVLRVFIDPVVLVLGTVPVLVAAPLFLLWFGVVPFTQVLLVAFYSAIMMVLFSQRAAENIDPVYERWAMTFGAGLGVRIRHILIPGTVPEIVGGLRITLASAWGLEVFAEILGAPSGMGQAIKALTNLNNVSGLLACVVIVAVTAIVTDILLLGLARRVAAWA